MRLADGPPQGDQERRTAVVDGLVEEQVTAGVADDDRPERVVKTAVGDVYDPTVADIARFARSLAPAGWPTAGSPGFRRPVGGPSTWTR